MNGSNTGSSSRLTAVIVGKNPKRTLLRASALAIFTIVVFKFILLPIRITDESMSPALPGGHFSCVNRLAYKWGKPQRGDVVAVRTATEKEVFLKRVVGLPGEAIAMENGTTKIDGNALAEPYAQANPGWNFEGRTLGGSEYLLINDNRSPEMGAPGFTVVSRTEFVGKVLF